MCLCGDCPAGGSWGGIRTVGFRTGHDDLVGCKRSIKRLSRRVVRVKPFNWERAGNNPEPGRLESATTCGGDKEGGRRGGELLGKCKLLVPSPERI